MKKFVAVMLSLCLSLMGMSVQGAENEEIAFYINADEVKSIEYNACAGQGHNDCRGWRDYDFGYEISTKPEIEKVTEYLNTIKLVDDGVVGFGADGDTTRIMIHYTNGKEQNIWMGYGRIEIDEKQYKFVSMEKGMDIFVYGLKKQSYIDNGDVSAWAIDTVEKAFNAHLAPISLNDNYTTAISRKNICLWLQSYLNSRDYLTKYDTNTLYYSNPFSDVNSDDDYIASLYKNGIISGISATEFAPDSTLTREQLAVILNNVLPLVGLDNVTEQYPLFADDSAISSWAKESVCCMVNSGLMQGKGDNRFAPQDEITKEEAICVLCTLNDKANGE